MNFLKVKRDQKRNEIFKFFRNIKQKVKNRSRTYRFNFIELKHTQMVKLLNNEETVQ